MCFLIWQKLYHRLFHGRCSSKVFHTRFDDLDLVSRSQMCQNHKQQVGFEILVHNSLNVLWFLHCIILKSSGTVRFASIILRDITDMIFFSFALECELTQCLLFVLLPFVVVVVVNDS